MPKYYRYTDRNGLIVKELTQRPSGYATTPREAITYMMNEYSNVVYSAQSKLKRAANILNNVPSLTLKYEQAKVDMFLSLTEDNMVVLGENKKEFMKVWNTFTDEGKKLLDEKYGWVLSANLKCFKF